MSNLEDEFQNLKLRLLLYGPPKSRKTWWAGTAAEAGFNVIYINSDDNMNIFRNLSKDAQSRMIVINCVDAMQRACCSIFLSRLLSEKPFVWNNKDKRNITGNSGVINADPHFLIDLSKLTPNDIVILDSWTANAISLFRRYCNENGINMAKAEEESNRWEGFRWTKALAEWQLTQLHDLNCHVIVIGHQSVYEKSRDEKDGNRTKKIVEWSRTQPISTSGPAAMSLAHHFTDVFYFEIAGNLTRINTEPAKNRDGGSTIVPPGLYDFLPGKASTPKTLDFRKVCQFAGIELPNNPEPQTAFRYFKPGEAIPFEEIVPKALQTNKTIIASKPAKENPASLSALTKAANGSK